MPNIGSRFVSIGFLVVWLFTAVCDVGYAVTHSQERTGDESFDGSITDIAGILVGHSSKENRPTGCTVILCNTTCVGGVDVRGSAPGTRETDLLDPTNAVESVNAIVFAGGSAFGLDAASGVMRCLAEKNIGFVTPARSVPIVPAAILYDLTVGDDPSIVPDAESGYAACMAANSSHVAEGNVGAGTGATIGKLFGISYAMKTGIGSSSLTVRDLITNATVTVGALVAVNAVGDVYRDGKLIAGARTPDGKQLRNTVNSLLHIDPSTTKNFPIGTATTLACVVTDAKLTKAQAKKISQMAHDGFARPINPIHTMADGDIIFTLATGASPISDVSLIGLMAAETVERAIIRAVEKATGLPGLPSIHELNSTGQTRGFDSSLLSVLTLVEFFLSSIEQ